MTEGKWLLGLTVCTADVPAAHVLSISKLFGRPRHHLLSLSLLQRTFIAAANCLLLVVAPSCPVPSGSLFACSYEPYALGWDTVKWETFARVVPQLLRNCVAVGHLCLDGARGNVSAADSNRAFSAVVANRTLQGLELCGESGVRITAPSAEVR